MPPQEPARLSFTSMNSAPPTQTVSTINAIKDFILTSHLQPGDPMPTESQLGDSLGVSRSSIREAVRMLVALDIVEVRHGHGTYVSQATSRAMVDSLVFRCLLNPGDDFRSLREVIEVRRTLDHALAESVVAAWQGRRSLPIDQLLAQMDQLARNGESFAQQDRSFHSMLLAQLPNGLYNYLADAFWSVYETSAPLAGAPRPEDALRSTDTHHAILQAARAGDAKTYCQACDAYYDVLLATLGPQVDRS